MPDGAGTGIGIGIGEGLSGIASGILMRKQRETAERDKLADKMEKDLQNNAYNLVEALGGQTYEQAIAAPGDHAAIQNLYNELSTGVQKYNALFKPHETNKLIARIQRLGGQQPATSQPTNPHWTTTQAQLAQATRTQRTGTDLVRDWGQLKQIARDRLGPDATPQQINDAAMEMWSRGAAGQSKPVYMVSPDGKSVVEGDEKDFDWVNEYLSKGWRKQEKAPAGYNVPKIDVDPLSKEPRSVTWHSQTWFGNQMETAPEEVQNAFKQATQTHKEALQQKADLLKQTQAAAQAKADRAFSQRVQLTEIQANNRVLTAAKIHDNNKAFDEITKQQTALEEALRQRNTMRSSLAAVYNADGSINQQAIVNIVANHLGMTAGQQKGIRISQALWNEAITSAPWLDNFLAKYGISPVGKTWDEWLPELLGKMATLGALSGVTVPPESLNQMVALGESRYNEMSASLERTKQLYQQVITVPSGVTKPKTPTTPTTTGGGQAKIKVQWKDPATGQVHTGTVDADKFDPKTMTRIGAQ